MRTAAFFSICSVLVLVGSADLNTSPIRGDEISPPALHRTNFRNKMGQTEAVRLASRLTYGMTEEDAIRFLEKNGLAMDSLQLGSSFGWSDAFLLSNGSLCLTIDPGGRSLPIGQRDGKWKNGLLREAFIYKNDGEGVSITLINTLKR